MGIPGKRAALKNDPDRKRWLPRKDTLVYAALLQVGLLAVAVFIVVVRPSFRSEPEFEAKKTIYLPQRELEHRVAVAELQQAASTPLQLDKLVTSAMIPPDLPAMPTVPKTDFNPLENADFLSRDAQALLAESGLSGAVGGLKTAASTAAFFGVEDSGERIVIVVNTSVSLRNKAERRGVAWNEIQAEVLKVINGLNGATLFGIVQFSQGVRQFPDFLAPATAGNREAASAWVKKYLRGNPPISPDQMWFGHEAALEAAFQLQPDVIFLVTDGILDRREKTGDRVTYPVMPYDEFIRSVHSFQQGSTRDARIHVVGFDLSSKDAENMRRLSADFGGKLRTF
jgi:hypothetical protein